VGQEGGVQGGSGNYGGVLQDFTGPLLQSINIYIWVPELEPVQLAPLLSDLIKGGVWVPGHRNA
jgi:nitrate/nitrite transporter NarK